MRESGSGGGLLRVERAPRIAVLLAACAASLVLAVSVAPAFLDATGRTGGGALRASFAPLCHGIQDRCLLFMGRPAALCARCSGLYSGGALGLAGLALGLTALRRRRLAWLVAAALPTLLDVAAVRVGLEGLANLPRFFSALPLGFVAGLLLAEGIEDLVRMRSDRRGVAFARPSRESTTRPLGGAGLAVERCDE